MREFSIDERIERAATLPSWVYSDPEVHARSASASSRGAGSWSATPIACACRARSARSMLLEGMLDEPLLLTRDGEDQLHCLSNVCTHRGNARCEGDGVEQTLRCRYHGRRFGLDGRFLSMPEFERRRGLSLAMPTTSPRLSVRHAGTSSSSRLARPGGAVRRVDRPGARALRLAAVRRGGARPDALARLPGARQLGALLRQLPRGFPHPLSSTPGSPARSTTASTAPSSSAGRTCRSASPPAARTPSTCRAARPDAGQRIAGYYFWLFPNLMFNVYPWGISVNVVKPLAVDRTKVTFLPYVWDASRTRPRRRRNASTASSARTRRSSRACSAACARASTTAAATRRRARPASTTSIGCWPRRSRDQRGEDGAARAGARPGRLGRRTAHDRSSSSAPASSSPPATSRARCRTPG